MMRALGIYCWCVGTLLGVICGVSDLLHGVRPAVVVLAVVALGHFAVWFGIIISRMIGDAWEAYRCR